jgi:mevalonate kinase
MIPAIGTSHAKTILLGEHAVVYGEPAIAIPVPTIRLRAELTPRSDERQVVTSAFYNGRLEDASSTRFAGVATLIRQLLVAFDAKTTGFDLNIISDLPPERGMGSSAATAVAIVRAFYRAFGVDLPHDVLLRWADVSERVIHGNPSGIDAATTSAERPQWLIRGNEPQNLAMPHAGVLVIGDTGVQGQTKAAVGAVAKRYAVDVLARDQIISLGRLTRRGAVALAENNLLELGKCMSAAQTNLAALGVSTTQIDKLVRAAMQAGALGAKLTGSGMGGCVIAIAPTAEIAEQVADAMSSAGAIQVWQHEFA